MKYTAKYAYISLKTILRKSLIVLIFIFLASCASQKERRLKKRVLEALRVDSFEDHFTGLLIYNPQNADTLLSINSNKYFTPASNTKIFTLYTALKILPDSIPALKYVTKQDTLYFSGTGDPSALHPHFQDSSSIQFIKRFKTLKYVTGSYVEDRFGPGWAWEDYDSAFSPEITSLPLYGNVVTLYKSDKISLIPAYFKDSVRLQPSSVRRSEDRNSFFIDPQQTDTLEVPFKNSIFLTQSLLQSAVGKPISLVQNFPSKDFRYVYSVPSDSLYKYMMHESDNLIAEQLLLIASAVLTDTLSSELSRDYMLDTYLANLPQKPRWVDGSGLSRYNLFTPASVIFVLDKLNKELPQSRLFTLFPAGGQSGTLEDWYAGDIEPYVFAKSGTLGNSYCLSGYLKTSSGKILLFSFMNNHFMEPTSSIKKKIEHILKTIRDTY